MSAPVDESSWRAPRDDRLAHYLQHNSLLTAAEVEAAKRLQEEASGKGEALNLGDALVRSGHLRPEQRDEALRQLRELPETGESLGPYRLIAVIGAGGMGAVFRAEEQPSGRCVAVKVLPREHSGDEEALRRFRLEAEAAFRLSHPNIVKGFSAGEDRGFAFYAMEYCEGETLDRRLKRDKFLPWKEALLLGAHAARALQYAHERGIVHRDIKPSNLLLTADGRTKVLDLGLSKKLVDLEQSFRTETGVSLGTPYYMAPEQAQGAKDLDGRSDLYSLGATLYHLMTGQVPFSGSTVVEILGKHFEAPRPDPKALRPELPDGVSHLVRKMMARHPDDRYRDAAELLSDLERVSAGQRPVGLLRGSAVERRSQVVRIAAACLLVVPLATLFLRVGEQGAAGPADHGTPRPHALDLLPTLDPARDGVYRAGFTGSWITDDLVLSLEQKGSYVSGTLFCGRAYPLKGTVRGRTLALTYGSEYESDGTLDLGTDGRSVAGMRGPRTAASSTSWMFRRVASRPMELAPALIRALREPDLATRRQAANMLRWGAFYSTDLMTALTEALGDQDPVVATYAAAFIGRAGAQALPDLVSAFGSAEATVRAAALRLIGHFGPQGQEAVPAVVEKLKDPDPRVRAAAAGALSSMGSAAETGIPRLVETLKDQDPRVRGVAIHALGCMGKAAVPTLVRLVGTGDLTDRRAAIRALGRFGSAPEVIAVLTEALKDMRLQPEAQRALDRLRPRTGVRVEPGRGFWPQWRGPDRDNVSPEGGLLKEWPEAGPPLLWEVQGIGTGIAAVTIGGGRIFTLGYVGSSEMLTALEERSGKLLWSSRVGDAFAEQFLVHRLAQRSPTLDGDRIYAVQAQGALVCFNSATGREMWRRDYARDLGAKTSVWRFCDRPLVDGDRLIVTGSGVAALSKATGQVLWKSESMGTSAHAATVATDAGGLRQYVTFVLGRMFSVDARNGKVLWTHEPFGQTANSSTPVVLGDSILAAAGYGVGLANLHLVPSYEGVVAHPRASARVQISSPFQDSAVALGRHAYFIGTQGLFCVEAETLKIVWGPERTVGQGNSSMTCAEGHLYVLSPTGQVALVEANPEKFVRKSGFQFPGFERGTGATNPVVAGGRLYLRHESRLRCHDISEGALKSEASKGNPRVLEIPAQGVAPTGAPFVATPQDVVERMLEAAEVRKEDTLYDLGSGDGRIVITAARKHGAKAAGFEIDEDLVKLSRRNVEQAGLGERVTIEQKDLFEVDLSAASVIAVYLPEKFLERLKPRLEQLRAGTRIVSHQFLIPGAVPDRTVTVESAEDGAPHPVHLWTLPFKRAKE